jgi:SagB-type dehydrogenase family enzyme
MQSEDDRLSKLLLPSEIYHENSKVSRVDWEILRRAQQDPIQRARSQGTYRVLQEYYDLIQFGAKQYPTFPRFPLPAVPPFVRRDLGEVLRQRRSVRRFCGKAMALPKLASILYFSYGVARYEEAQNHRFPRRVVPSGGGLYPLEVYALVLDVEGLDPGAYHYEVYSHALEQLAPGDLREELRHHLLNEELIVGTTVAVVVSGVFERSRFKYGELGYRLVLLEAGHVGQNVCLTATALGLGVCPVAGFVEDSINDLLGLDGVDETALYLFVIGNAQESSDSPLQVHRVEE